MELEKLLKERESFHRTLIPLGIKIALILAIPAVLAVMLVTFAGLSKFLVLPLAIIISWTGIILVYRKSAKKLQVLDARILELQNQEINEETHPSSNNK